MRSLVLVAIHACATVNSAAAVVSPEWDLADPVPRRQLNVDLDEDGNEDIYFVADARTDTPKSTFYAKYRADVIEAYGCGTGLYGYGCSKRLCSYGQAWVADSFMSSDPSDELYVPWGDSTVGGMHAYQECSGKGICNRLNGKCSCFDGYHGKGCRYKECPNNCGEHGVCQPAYVVNSAYQSLLAPKSQFWDYDRSFRCECDYGYTGVDCSDKICPEGLDPVDPADCVACGPTEQFCGAGQQLISFPDALQEGTWFYLEFETKFGGVPFRTHPIRYTAATPLVLAGDIQLALEGLPNEAIPTIQTRVVDNEVGYAASIQVAFTDATTAGRQHLLACVAPSTTDTSCTSGAQPMIDSTNALGVDCEVSYYNEDEEVNTAYTCSARGECDTSNGKCQCHSGFNGQRCETMFSFF